LLTRHEINHIATTQHCFAVCDDEHGVALFAVILHGADDLIFGGIVERGSGFVEDPDDFLSWLLLFAVGFKKVEEHPPRCSPFETSLAFHIPL